MPLEEMTSDGQYIISYWNNPDALVGSLHTVAFKVEEGKYYVYNPLRKYDDHDDFLNRFGKGFITGYRVK